MLITKLLNHNKKPRGLKIELLNCDRTTLVFQDNRPAIEIYCIVKQSKHLYMLDTGRIELWSKNRVVPNELLRDMTHTMRQPETHRERLEVEL